MSLKCAELLHSIKEDAVLTTCMFVCAAVQGHETDCESFCLYLAVSSVAVDAKLTPIGTKISVSFYLCRGPR